MRPANRFQHMALPAWVYRDLAAGAPRGAHLSPKQLQESLTIGFGLHATESVVQEVLLC